MVTTVWRCEPRSHGRRKAATPLPGRRLSFAVPHRSASPAVCPCGHSASFRRRASSFVRGFWSSAALLLAAVRGGRARCMRRAVRRACACCCPVVAAVGLSVRRRVRCDSRDAWRACRAKCVRGGCVRARAGCEGGGGFACPSCERGVALLRERRACAPPVPVLEMPLMPPRVAGAVAAAESPLC